MEVEQPMFPLDWQSNEAFSQFIDYESSNANITMEGMDYQYSGAPADSEGFDPTLLLDPQLGASTSQLDEQEFGFDLLQNNNSVEYGRQQTDLGSQNTSPQASTVTFSERGGSYEPTIAPAKVKKTRKSKKKPLTEEERKEKLTKKLARNSEAASKCRQKKKIREGNMQAQVEQLRSSNTHLNQVVAGLRRELAGLTEIFEWHNRDNPKQCTHRQELEEAPAQARCVELRADVAAVQIHGFSDPLYGGQLPQLGAIPEDFPFNTAEPAPILFQASQNARYGSLDQHNDATRPVSQGGLPKSQEPLAVERAMSVPAASSRDDWNSSASHTQPMEREGSKDSRRSANDSGVSSMGTPDKLKELLQSPPKDEGYAAQDHEPLDYFQASHEVVKPVWG